MITSRRSRAHGSLDRSRRRVRCAPILFVAVLLAALVTVPLAGAVSPAAAMTRAEVVEPADPTAPTEPAPQDSTTPTPSLAPLESNTPSPSPAPAAPTIDSPAAGSFVGGSVSVSGSRDPGQKIQLLSPAGGDPLCIIEPDGSSTWQCGVRLPSGPDVTLRAVVEGDSGLAATISVRVLQAPSVTGGPTGTSSSNGLVRGTGYPGATVTAVLASGQRCSFTVDGSGAWACLMQGLVSGTEQVTASQQTGFSAPDSSPASDPVTLQFDVDAPAPPTVAGPAAGSTVPPGAPYFGQGENGATVTVFAGAYSLCSTVVSGGTWSCTGSGVADGSYDLRAVQQDAAGNVSAGSAPIRVSYGAAPATPTPPAETVPAPTTAPQPTTAPVPAPTATPVPTPAPAVPPGTPSATPAPGAPDDEAGDLPPTLTVPGGWNDPTQFSTAVIPPWTVASFPWLQAGLLTLGALLLLVVPARLLAGTLSRARNGRPLFQTHRFAGRNRAREEFEVAPTVRVNRWVGVGAAITAAAVFVLLSGPVAATPSYLRLLLAVALALAVVNAAATLVPQWWGARALHVDVALTILPRYLAVIAVTALASRLLDLHPALLFGLLGSVVVRSGPALAQRGQLAAMRAGTLLVLGLVGLLVVGVLPEPGGFVGALAAEFANTVVLVSIGSAVLVLIPLGSTSGRSILAWSPPIWAALTVPAWLALFTLLSPWLSLWQGEGPTVLLWVALVFAVLSVTAWAWQRFVLPALRQ